MRSIVVGGNVKDEVKSHFLEDRRQGYGEEEKGMQDRSTLDSEEERNTIDSRRQKQRQ